MNFGNGRKKTREGRERTKEWIREWIMPALWVGMKGSEKLNEFVIE